MIIKDVVCVSLLVSAASKVMYLVGRCENIMLIFTISLNFLIWQLHGARRKPGMI
jgi:hypothetical protein